MDEHGAPSIGLRLCKDAQNRVKVDFARRDVRKPIGVAEWMTRLAASLPMIADIERELNKPRHAAKKAKKAKK